MSLTIDINGKCNIRCEFCYQDLDGSVLSEEDMFRIVKEDSSETVEIGGGEPLLDKRIANIITQLRKQGKRVHISTNATHVPQNVLELEDAIREGTQMQVSLHASNPELYREIVGVRHFDSYLRKGNNLFETVIENTRLINEKYSTVISTAVYKKNVEDVPNIVELASSLEIPIRVNLVMKTGAGKNVELIDTSELDHLRGYLLGQRYIKGSMVESPLVHIHNNCSALSEAYGIEKKGPCPVDCGTKKYVDPKGGQTSCEFYTRGGTRK